MVRIYSLEMVARRLIPLIVVLALAFAPVALEVCEASCQSRGMQTTAPGSAPHVHSHAAAQASAMPAGHVHDHGTGTHARVVMAAHSHPCEHGDELPAFSPELQNTFVAPAIVASP